MKKRWIPVLLLALVVAILIGVRFGIGMEYQRILEARDIDAIAPTAVAVVNSDTGVIVDGENLNYSAAIIETLGEGFVLVSPAMAQSGLEQGIYSAILTFPSHVSERIVAFNTGNPERVQLEFRVNPDLPESEYIRTHIKILNLQLAINLTVANTYVSSLFSQLHFAQDEMDAVFHNSQLNIYALELVYLRDFTPDLELDILPYVEFEPNDPDTSEHFSIVEDFAIRVGDVFSFHFEIAAGIHIYDVLELVGGFVGDLSAQHGVWAGNANDWVRGWEDFAEDTEDHYDAVLDYLGELEDWKIYNALPWHTALATRYGDLDAWYTELVGWYVIAGYWYTDTNAEIVALNNAINQANLWRSGSGSPNLQLAFNEANNRPNRSSITCECPCYNYPICDHALDPASCFCDPSVCPPLGGPCVQSPACEANRDAIYLSQVTGWALAVTAYIQSAIAADQIAVANLFAELQPLNLGTPPVTLTTSGPPLNANRPIGTIDVRPPPPPWDYIENPIPAPAPTDPRPEPDDILESFTGIQESMMEFDVDDFWTPYLLENVGDMMSTFDSFLEFIRGDLYFQFMENVFILFDVRQEYIEYLNSLRLAALESEYDVRAYLQGTLYEFFNAVSGNEQDTYYRLSGFSGMLPESRTAAGVNQDLVNFTVAPFEFVAPFIRVDLNDEITVSDAFEVLLWIAIIILAIFIIVAITLTILEIVKKMKAESK